MSWKNQPRDSKGRFGKTTLPRYVYTIDDIKDAWIAGHNDKGLFHSIRHKVQRYLESVEK
jgi:hypothetical protein